MVKSPVMTPSTANVTLLFTRTDPVTIPSRRASATKVWSPLITSLMVRIRNPYHWLALKL